MRRIVVVLTMALVMAAMMLAMAMPAFAQTKYPTPPPAESEEVACYKMVGYYPPGHPCFDGYYYPQLR